MSVYVLVLLGTGLSFLGTVIGSSIVLFLKKINEKFERFCLGLSAGVMMSACVFSLIIPSMNMSEASGGNKLIPVTLGLIFGGMFILLLDKIIPHLHLKTKRPEGVKVNIERSLLLVLAVTLHNIPEGMAVGVSFSSIGNEISLASCFALSIGMFLQNIPEGASVALPILKKKNKKSAFLLGSLSGIVEPIFGLITVFFISFISNLLPYFLSFAAGAMIYVIVEELIPESVDTNNHSHIGVISFMVGFIIMLILEIALS